MRYLPITLLALLLAAPAIAQEGERIVEESGGLVLVEKAGGVRYWTSRQDFDRRAEREQRRQANRRRQCENKLENLQRALDGLRAANAGATAECAVEEVPETRQRCEQLRRSIQISLPNHEEYVTYARKQANLVCSSSVMGPARPTALPANLETAARDVLLEALGRILGGRP